jgi:SRSO17 transposase
MISKAEQKLIYPISLFLSTGKKTSESLASSYGKSGDTMLRILDKQCVTIDELVRLAVETFGTNFLHVILDDTLIEKMHSKYIEGSGDNYDSSNGRTYRSLSTVVAALSNGKFVLPVHHEFWIKKEVDTDKYKTKIEIAQELIQQLRGPIRINMIILDGLYASEDMLYWLDKNDMKYEMRFHSNRKIFDSGTKTFVKVREHKELQLNNKRSSRTIKTMWKNLSVYITAVKRTNRKGIDSIVYQISNFKMHSRKHVCIYSYRWNIESFFRTAKQHLGLTHCQSRKKTMQKNHISNVFFAYAILQLERKNRKLKTPEAALRALKHKTHPYLTCHLTSLDQILQAFRATHA